MKTAKIALMLTATIIMATGSAGAANSLDVNATAALEGNFGLEINHDGSTNLAYVETDSPDGESIYRAQFMIHPEASFVMDGPNNHALLLARQDSPATSPFRLVLGRFRDGRQFIRAFFNQDNGNFRFLGGMIIGVGSTTTVMIEWSAATSNGANDGVMRMYKNGNLLQQRSDIDNDTYVVDRVRLGAAAWVDASTVGSVYLDSFESYRTFATP